MGGETCASCAANVTPAVTAIAAAKRTRPSVMLLAPASIAAYVKAPKVVMAITCPTESNGTRRRGDGAERAINATAPSPTGRLMKKTSRHETSVNKPPTTGPDEEAIAPPIAQIAT